MRTLEVVRLNVQREPPLAVGEVLEHRPRQELVPQRLPETLHLPQRHGVLWAALDVLDAVLPQRLLERRLAAPRRVLPAVVREDLLGGPVVRDAALERLHHQLALLVMRDDVRDQVPRVIVHERRHVHPLVLAQQEREDVRLPHLHRARALEAPRRLVPALRVGRSRVHQSGVVQDAPNLRLAHTHSRETRQQIADPPRARLRVRALLRDHRLLQCARGHRPSRFRSILRQVRRRWLRDQPIDPARLIAQHPLLHRRGRDPEHARDLLRWLLAVHHLADHPRTKLDRVRVPVLLARLALLLSRHLPSPG